METLSVASKKPFSMKIIESTLSENWPVETSIHNDLVVHGATSRVYVCPEAKSEETPRYRLLLDYSDVELVKSVLEKIADDPAFTVDNDFGTVLPGDEFVARCKAERGWDWRH